MSKICDFCGKEHATEVQTFADYKNGDRPINLCFRCLATVHYCDVCNRLVLESIDYKDKVICHKCKADANINICNFCGELVSYKLDEHGACKECAPKLVFCSDCGVVALTLASAEDEAGVSKSLCNACIAKEQYAMCPACGVFKPKSVFNKKYGYCKTCLGNAKECYSCHRPIFGKSIYKIAPDTFVCCDCVIEDNCASCGTPVDRRNKIYNFRLSLDEGEGNRSSVVLCKNCHVNKNFGVIKRYGYKPVSKFKKVDGAEFTPLFIGIENEVSFPSGRFPQERVRSIFDENEHHWYIKRDGSVTNGFEIVTHPMHFEYIKQGKFPIGDLFKSDFGICKSSSTGMHIHMSKDAFTNAHLFKFMQFFINEPAFCEKVAERGSNSYCSKLGKTEMVEKAIKKSGGSRNQVNLNPAYTVEVRAFAGATTKEQYLKNVEFVYALFCFTKVFSIINLNKEKFIEYIQKDREKYSNLLAFLNV